MARIYLDQQTVKQAAPKKQRIYLDQPKAAPKQRVYLDNKPAPKQTETGGLWRKVGNQLTKPVASVSNLLEDTGKGIAAAGISALTPATFKEVAKKIDFNPIQHQKDVLSGKNKRTYSTIMNEVADKEDNRFIKGMQKTIGYGSDFILDPLNKVKIAELTAKGLAAQKVGKLGLSAAEQAGKGERALLQFGKTNILPSVGNKVLSASTKANDVFRGTKTGAQVVDAAHTIFGVRPSGVTRPEWKTITENTRSFKKSSEYASQQALKAAADIEKSLNKAKATPEMRSALLHAVEKGDASLAPKGLEEIFQKASSVKRANEATWKQAGGATLDNYGLPHLATDAVKETSPTVSVPGGGRIYTQNTPQDIHREWVKVDGKITNLKKAGIKYDEKSGVYFQKVGQETKAGGFKNKWAPVTVEQASAPEINKALVADGKTALFKESLPESLATGGISAGRKAAGQTFLRNTKGVTSDKGREMLDATYQRLTNNEAVHKALKAYDKVLGVWKAQVLVAPSYHVRNEVGNIWNNYLANVTPVDMALAAKLQGKSVAGKLDDAERALLTEMEQQGVIGGGLYGRDIAQNIADEVGNKSFNPLSQRFGLYKGNRAIGEGFENNARIAHYLAKRRDGYSAVEAAKSVDKFLFDYGDLTWIEQNVLKRALPFYTWASKNIPLQLESFVKNPGKFSKAATLQKDIEENIPKKDERYMSEYLSKNSPMRIRDNKDGSTEYLLLGQWIPATQAIQFLSQAPTEIIRGVSPLLGIGANISDVTLGTDYANTSFFKNTLGQDEPIEKTPGELGSFLGFDMRKKTVNLLRGVRVLNEIDKLNPGAVFGDKNKPSVFQGLTDNASETRGTKHSPDSDQTSRTMGFLLGKTSTYNPENSKTFYDYDTKDRMDQYTQQMNQALKLGQPDLAAKILKEMEQFNSDREGTPNKHIQNYNLMGERYFQDLAQNKAAELNRDEARKRMREMIRKSIETGDRKMLQEAIMLDPSYAKDAMSDALKEKGTANSSQKEQKMYYELEQMKTKSRLKPFY